MILVSKIDDTPSRPTGASDSDDDLHAATRSCRCYAGDGNQDGLTFIHGWNDEPGTPADHVIRDVYVLDSDVRRPFGAVLPPHRGL